MFWSKIWFFLVAVGAATALTIALVMPRPAERKEREDEHRRLVDACSVTNILLTENARHRIDLAGQAARFSKDIADTLWAASSDKEITPDHNMTARTEGKKLLESLKDVGEPDFIIMLDNKGRAVVRLGIDTTTFGDSLAGYPLVDDALAGYLRDDIWLLERNLYLVAAAPVINRMAPGSVWGEYAGAIVLGHAIDKEFATSLAEKLKFNVSFYVGERSVANSTAIQLHKDMVDHFQSLGPLDHDREADCSENKPFYIEASGDSYAALEARLPGEAAHFGAFYAVYAERPKAVGFSGTFDAVTKDDLSFGHFPWIPVGGTFLLVVAIGILLMIIESDRPLRRLTNDAVALAKGEKDRLDEERHRGKFGSIARSVNIELDKKQREAKAAKKDLDQLLGPAPDDGVSLGGGFGKPSALPSSGPTGPSTPVEPPPPPSDFKFGGKKKKKAATPPPATPAAAPFELDLPPPPPATTGAPSDQQVPPPPVTLPPVDTPAPKKAPTPTPPPLPIATPPPPPPVAAIDDDILADSDEDSMPSSPGFDDPTVVADPDRSLLDASAARDEDTAAESDQGAAPDDSDEAYLRHVFEEFVGLKKKCGEPITNLTFQKFAAKLKKNRKALIAKHGCSEVKFQVYIKDGKAALKATPVKS